MAGADAEGRCGGRRAAVWLLVLALASGCSATTARDDEAAPAASLEVPPAPATAGAAPSAARVAQTATRIEKVAIESAPPTTRVVLKLDGTAEPEVSLLMDQRLVIDVPNTTCVSLPRTIEAGDDPLVERVRTGQHGAPENKSRVVIDLRQRADFSVRAQGDRIVAYLAPAGGGAAGASSGSADGSRILFGAEAGAGEGRALAPPSIPAGAPVPPPPPEPVATPVAEPLPEATLPPPPIDAAPPVEGTPAAIVATPALVEATSAPYVEPKPSAAQAAPGPGIEVLPERAPAAEPGAAPPPVSAASAVAPTAAATPAAGKRISIDFTDGDVRTVIELIASAGGYHVLFAPEVGGTVTISVVDRPWEDALATVLRAKRLREVRHEDVMLVSPAGR